MPYKGNVCLRAIPTCIDRKYVCTTSIDALDKRSYSFLAFILLYYNKITV